MAPAGRVVRVLSPMHSTVILQIRSLIKNKNEFMKCNRSCIILEWVLPLEMIGIDEQQLLELRQHRHEVSVEVPPSKVSVEVRPTLKLGQAQGTYNTSSRANRGLMPSWSSLVVLFDPVVGSAIAIRSAAEQRKPLRLDLGCLQVRVCV